MKKKKNDAGRSVGTKLRKVGGWLLDLLYPPRCVLCDALLKKKEQGCCSECRGILPWISGPVCLKCGKPVGGENMEYCEDCRTQTHCFDQGAAVFTYTGPLRQAVYRMKFSNRRDYIPFFGKCMAAAVERNFQKWRPEVVIPVPMYRAKRRSRGYNQAELLADEISRLTGIPVEKNLLRCVRLVQSQKELDRRARMKNLRGCFTVNQPFPHVSGVLLVDDVYTTGSTLDELSRVLRMHGAERIFFVVLCTGKGKKSVGTPEKI